MQTSVSSELLLAVSTLAQVKRLMKRDACSKPQAEAKVKAQMPLKLKQDKSQIVLDNSGNKHHCEQQVIHLCKQTFVPFCALNSHYIPACAAHPDWLVTAMYHLECQH